MTIKVCNYADKDVLNVSLPLIIGEVVPSSDSKIFVQNNTFSLEPVIWPVINGKFKVLVQLQDGENKISFRHKHCCLHMTLIYTPLKYKKFVRLVYIKCNDDEGKFQAPPEEDNSILSACKRLSLGAQMLQTFTYDKVKEHNLNGKTFRLEETNGRVMCHVFTSSLSLKEAYKLSDEQLWSHFAVELMNSNLRVGNDCKFLSFLSFTRYCNDANVLPRNHQEILQMTKGQVALGGGGLALFGSACLHTWPENLQEIPWRFGDKRRVDRMKFMDDSRYRGWHWACYSTGLGATLHELGHTFDLGHTQDGIMGRGFDDIYKYFIVDMFYHSHMFQENHNPFYQKTSIHNHTISLDVTSPVSWEAHSGAVEQNIDLSDSNIPSGAPFEMSNNNVEFDNPDVTSPVSRETRSDATEKNFDLSDLSISSGAPIEMSNNNVEYSNPGEKPWRIPNPPEKSNDANFAVNVGGAYWTRSSALILYYHKWFNIADVTGQDLVSFDGTKLSSSHGIRVVEFRDNDGTAFHHLEFPEEDGNMLVDLPLYDIATHIPDGISKLSFIAEDSVGNVLKSKLDVEKFLPKNVKVKHL